MDASSNIHFHKRELAVGPRLSRNVAREDFLGAAKKAGFFARCGTHFPAVPVLPGASSAGRKGLIGQVQQSRSLYPSIQATPFRRTVAGPRHEKIAGSAP